MPLPFIAWLIHTVRDRLRTGFEKIDRVWSEVTNVLADTIPRHPRGQGLCQEKREAERFRAANQHNMEVNDRLNKTWSLFAHRFADDRGRPAGGVGLWHLAGRAQPDHRGVLAAFIAYIGRFYTRLDSMSRIVSVTQKAAAGAKRILTS